MIPGIVAGAPVAAGPVVTDNAWDPTKASPRALLSNSNLTVAIQAGAGIYGTVGAVKAVTGLCYFSGTPNASGGGETAALGLGDSTVTFTDGATWVGDGSLSAGCWPNVGTVYFGGSSVGSAGSSATSDIQIAVRVSSRRVWIRRAGGAWVGGGDPAADTSPTCTLTGTGSIFPMASISAGSASAITLHKDAAQTTGTVPSGFTPANWA